MLAGVLPSFAAGRFEKDILAFEERDRAEGLHAGCVLFIGSSSIRGWQSLEQDFAGLDVINRGFGGSAVRDSTLYLDRIVVPHKPRLIVFYAGDNDIAGGRSPQQVLKDYKQFVSRAQAALPRTRIAFISIKPSPLRWKFAPRMAEANRLVAEYSRRTPGLDFIDVWPSMLDRDGQPRRELFKADMLHLNESGYKLWTAIVRPHLQ